MPLFAPFEPHVRGWQDPDASIRVATEADAAAVTAVAGCRGPLPEGFIERVVAWADDRGRRRGVGDRMLGHLSAWTWDRADRLWSVVNARNTASLVLHVRHGFAETGRAGSYAGITFEGGEGVLLCATRPEEDA